MFTLNGTRLFVSKGDTGTLTITATGKTFTASDKALFTVVNNQTKEVVLQRVCSISSNVVTVEFDDDDTKNLTPGAYKWEIRYVVNATVSNDEITGGDEIITPAQPFDMTVLDVLAEIGVTGATGST